MAIKPLITMSNSAPLKLAIIGLGYVGLPLAVEFGKKYVTIGFDVDSSRIKELKLLNDRTLEVERDEIIKAKNLSFTTESDDISGCNIYIVTVPTPIDQHNRPDLAKLKRASEVIGSLLSPNDIVIYESTVYPGATEEVCVPILEKYSGLTFGTEKNNSAKVPKFFVGYSPERINPGDKKHRLPNIKKITSGSTINIAEKIDGLYKTIIKAGTHKANSIKVAEAAKVIENTQRDVNIALINELALIFDRLEIDTESVLEAAGTKWNFLPFRPGLVGGHCISVDPYYLTHKAIEVGYNPEMVLAGRRLNDGMGYYVVEQVTKLMANKDINVVDSNILIMGLAFKEDCPDLRNTRVIDIYNNFRHLNCNVDIYDPLINPEEAKKEYDINLIDSPMNSNYDAIILAVAHNQFRNLPLEELKAYGKANHILYDIKYLFKKNEVDGRL